MLQAEAAARAGDWVVAQALFLEAGLPAKALAALAAAGCWQDALHFAELNLPQQVHGLSAWRVICTERALCSDE